MSDNQSLGLENTPSNIPQRSSAPRILLGLLVAGGVIWNLVFMTRDTIVWLRSFHWEATDALVEVSDIQTSEWKEVGEPGPRVTVEYNPIISFSYQFQGIPYESSRLMIGERFRSARFGDGMKTEAAERYVSRYTVGSTLRVYVDPKDPHYAVIERRVYLTYWRDLVLLTFLGYLAIRLLIPIARSRSGSPKAGLWIVNRSPRRMDFCIAAVWIVAMIAMQNICLRHV
jgi:hypothetical protein